MMKLHWRAPFLIGMLLTVVSWATAQTPPSSWEQKMAAGALALNAGKYADAESLYMEMEAVTAGGPASGFPYAFSLGQLGMARLGLGRFADATDLLRRAIVILDTIPERHSQQLAAFWHGLGSSLYYQHLYPQASHAYEKALALSSANGDAAHLLSNLGSAYQMQHRYQEAEAAFERARTLAGDSTEADRFLRVNLLSNSGALYRAQGLHPRAERMFQEAVNQLPGLQDPDGILTVTLLNNLALEFMGRRDYSGAAGMLAQAISRIEHGTALPRSDVAQILQHYRACLEKASDRKSVRRFDARAKLILAALPSLPQDNALVDVSRLGRR